MSFPFTRLPPELALEVVRFASAPDCDAPSAALRPSYATAASMAAVSYDMRRATMPHLLHTVILSTTDQTLSFIDSIILQKQFAASSSRLTLDYTKLVRRFWCTEVRARLMDDTDYTINYGALYEIIRGVDSLGMDMTNCLHLLYGGLSSPQADPERDWTCRRLTFAGAHPRWNPLTSTLEGSILFSRITHLTLWISTDDDDVSEGQSRAPLWLKNVPFASFRNLSHLAVLLPPKNDDTNTNPISPPEMLVCVAPASLARFEAQMLRERVSNDDIFAHGVVLPICNDYSVSRSEFWFMARESEAAWAQMDRLRTDE
ncbi:hypothetical protein R3P38DRAFT_2841491 [Favolaschia claudopus]|uniref:F-box domain-containing protein n=1 Tax=Favolaschia claudopus TaxID=2862362 RepID=A0AAW0E0W3_9AGAR